MAPQYFPGADAEEHGREHRHRRPSSTARRSRWRAARCARAPTRTAAPARWPSASRRRATGGLRQRRRATAPGGPARRVDRALPGGGRADPRQHVHARGQAGASGSRLLVGDDAVRRGDRRAVSAWSCSTTIRTTAMPTSTPCARARAGCWTSRAPATSRSRAPSRGPRWRCDLRFGVRVRPRGATDAAGLKQLFFIARLVRTVDGANQGERRVAETPRQPRGTRPWRQQGGRERGSPSPQPLHRHAGDDAHEHGQQDREVNLVGARIAVRVAAVQHRQSGLEVRGPAEADHGKSGQRPSGEADTALHRPMTLDRGGAVATHAWGRRDGRSSARRHHATGAV